MFLSAILEVTRARVSDLAPRRAELMAAAAAAPVPPAWRASLLGGPDVAVIAEVKRRSPSAGVLAPQLDPAAHARACVTGGARAISVLTEPTYFDGTPEDLTAVRGTVPVPVLRKDFLLDPLQLYETKAMGASAVLLIVRVLDDRLLEELSDGAAELGLGRLIEVHTAPELERAVRLAPEAIGVNSRDLETFRIDRAHTKPLLRAVPGNLLAVAESGIATREDVAQVARWGADAILVGTALARGADPGTRVVELTGIRRRGRETAVAPTRGGRE